MEIKVIDGALKEDVIDFIKDNWGSGIMVVKGRVHNMELLPGYVALEDNKIIGLVTYNIDNEECENEEMLEIMKENDYEDMSRTMEFTGRKEMINMHNSMMDGNGFRFNMIKLFQST